MSQTDRCSFFTMRKTRCHIFQKCHNRLLFTTWFLFLTSQGVMSYETVFPRNVSSWIRFFLLMKTNSSFPSVPKKKNRVFWHSQPDPSSISLYHITMSKCVTSQCTTQPRSPILSAVFYQYRGFIYSDWSGKWGPMLWKELLGKTV